MSSSASRSDGFLVECILNTGQRLHSDPFGEFDREDAVKLAVDLLRRTMVQAVYILRIGTGEVVFDQASLVERAKHLEPALAPVSAPRDRILLSPPKHPAYCGCNACEHFRGEHGS